MTRGEAEKITLGLDEKALKALRHQCNRRLAALRRGSHNWDEADEERLRFLWLKTRRSITRIAEDMDLTRGQVAGRLRDLGLLGSVRPVADEALSGA